MKYFLLLLPLLFPLPASALRVDNCDDEPHEITLRYSGSERSVILPAGQGRYFAGIPIELQSGTDIHQMIDYDSEWCIWGENDLQIQKRNSPRRGR